jgi:hypothetical protein
MFNELSRQQEAAQASGDDSVPLLEKKDLEGIRDSLKVMSGQLASLQSETKMSSLRRDSLNEIVQDNNMSGFYTTLTESLVFVAIAAA